MQMYLCPPSICVDIVFNINIHHLLFNLLVKTDLVSKKAINNFFNQVQILSNNL